MRHVSLQDVFWLATGSILGVGASMVMAYVPELLRTIRARNATHASVSAKKNPATTFGFSPAQSGGAEAPPAGTPGKPLP
jgi:hypothetical protein